MLQIMNNVPQISGKYFLTVISAVTLLLVMVCPRDIQSQYFGRNKVQYETFDFNVMKTENFDIYYYSPESLAVSDAARMMERWNYRLSPIFNHKLVNRQPMIIYANHADFQQTNVIGSIISQGTGGFTESRKNRIVLPLTGVYRDNDHVIGHELVHAYQYDLMKAGEDVSRGAANQMPLWFIEGMAEYLSIGRQDALTGMWLRDAFIYEKIPSFSDLSRDPRYFPYRWGHAVWAYVGSKYGDRVVGALYRNIIVNGWRQGFENVIKINPDSLSTEWQNYLKKYYSEDRWNLRKPDEAGEAIITGNNGFNLAPSISPDGQYVAFLSRKDLFSIDLYMANAQTGEVIKKLVSSQSDAHFDALRFMDAAGSWSPDGSKFAFVVFKSGDNSISIVDISSQNIEQTLQIESADAILDVAWSPDGKSIVYTGLDGGISDLFLYDFKTKSSVRLTNDRFANIQPSWSPDGKKLLFVTDQGPETTFGNLEYGTMKIGMLDLKNDELSFIQLDGARKHINPQYSQDGQNIYFVGDRNGYSNIYRYSLQEQEFYQITDISTGVSGLTELSPVFSLAKHGNRMAFSVFQDADYNIYARKYSGTEGELVTGPWTNQGREIPVYEETKGENLVDQYINNAVAGLPGRRLFPIKDYDPSLQLISAGQTGIGVAVDRFGAALGGAVNFVFSDMLGNHLLGVAAQVNGSYKDIGGQAVYMNQKRRLNWGGLIGHIPYRSVRT
ncbi:MAG: peptidase S9, partial [Calditrichaeota bacterium]